MDWVTPLINLATILAGVALGSIIGTEIGIRIAIRRIRKMISKALPRISSELPKILGDKRIDLGFLGRVMLSASTESGTDQPIPSLEVVAGVGSDAVGGGDREGG